MKHKVETPPKLQGSAEQQLRQMHSYLFRMAEGLNVVLGNLSETKPQESGSGNAYNELRALIGNTAESVKELRKEIGKENGETATIDPLQLMPVGYIYISSDPTSPAELFGGTWTQLKDRFLLGAGSSYSNGATGGAATHTLTIDEMPPHRHSFQNGSHTFLWGDGVGTVNINGTQAVAAAASGNSLYTIQGAWASTNGAGGSQPHNNMPPYLVVYMWKRTA